MKLCSVVLLALFISGLQLPCYCAGRDEDLLKAPEKSVRKKAPGQPAGTKLVASQFEAQRVVQLIFDLTNKERKRVGLKPLEWNDQLADAAARHSADMANRGYFSHQTKGFLRRPKLRDRAQQSGGDSPRLAENIAMIPTFRSQQVQYVATSNGYAPQMYLQGDTYEEVAGWAMREWMNSEGHRRNILSPDLSTLGVGVAIGQRGDVPYVYLTQDFGGN